jgi:hypothetical protein
VGSGKDSREAGERANRLGRGARLPNNLNGQTKSSIWLSRECASPTPAPSRVPARAMVPMGWDFGELGRGGEFLPSWKVVHARTRLGARVGEAHSRFSQIGFFV